ncbi:histidine kinase [Roseateles violae]|uniref:Histidine kinase n=1 Tax=Roseateles violae TaxID=3058042 RepID=A0ABT8DWD2_9BURK|nr:histidine kinase [Pelomonas sp. PFR6]MDN3922570.1 histidine kinase [Pelomonas sp. PFR6]
MSAVLHPPRSGQPAALLGHLLRAWRSLHWQELAAFALAGLLFGLIDLSSLLEIDVGTQLAPVVMRHLLLPVVACLALLAVWLPADRSERQHPKRPLRLALAVLIGSALAMLISAGVEKLLPWPSVSDLMRAKKGLPPMPSLNVAGMLGDTLWVFMPSAMMIAVVELLRRRRHYEESVQKMLHEHSQIKRRAMAARLAALQAQVEPQLLFDALVDIEQAYGRADARAPARMEQLIRHLRVALPRLRESGSSLEAEADLLESYLGVLQGLGQATPRFEARWPAELRGASVPPMLLLPLLQRALRLAELTPSCCSLSAETHEGGLRVLLEFDRPGLCGDDAELQSLAERLRVLSGGPARLACRSLAGTTLFTLELNR